MIRITRKLPEVHVQPPQARYSLFARVSLAEQRQRDADELARSQKRIEALLQAMPERKGNEAC